MKNTILLITAILIATISFNISTSFGSPNEHFLAWQHSTQLGKNHHIQENNSSAEKEVVLALSDDDRRENRALHIQTSTEQRLPEQVAETLTDTYGSLDSEGRQVFFKLLSKPSMSEYTHSKSISKLFCKDSGLIDNFLSCEAHIYKQRLRYHDNEGKTNLTFTLRMLTYADVETLHRSRKSIYTSADPDTGLSYAWDHLVTRGTRLYWLHAPCTFSENAWNKLVVELENAIAEDTLPLTSKFTCACGLPCRER